MRPTVPRLPFHAPGSPISWRRNLYAITIAQALAIIGFTLRESFLPFYLQSIGAESTNQATVWSGLINAAGAGIMVFAQPFWGAISDRRGRKPMLLRAMFGAMLTVGLMAAATQPWHLLVLRLLEGALTGTVAASTALVATTAPKERLGFSLGLVQTAVFSGASLGPFVGGVMADLIGYRLTFAISGGMLGLAAVIVYFMVWEEFTPVARSSERGFRAMRRNAAWLLAPILVTMIGVLSLIRFAQSAVRPILPLYMEFVGGFTGVDGAHRAATLTGIALGLLGLSSAISSVYFGRRGDRVGHRKILLLTVTAAGLLYLPMAIVTQPWELILLQGLFGVAAGGMMPAANALIAAHTAKERRGMIFGVTTAAGSLGGFFGPLAGAGIAAFYGFRATVVATAIMMLIVAAVIAWSFTRPQNAAIEDAEAL